jgi:hypothetical protein
MIFQRWEFQLPSARSAGTRVLEQSDRASKKSVEARCCNSSRTKRVRFTPEVPLTSCPSVDRLSVIVAGATKGSSSPFFSEAFARVVRPGFFFLATLNGTSL